MEQENNKSFYALNLTPERITMIFIGFIVVIAVILMVVFFSMYKKESGGVDNFNYNFSDASTEVGDEIDLSVDADDEFNNDEIEFTSILSDDNIQTKELTVTKSDESADVVKDDAIVKLDNSEVIYSSSYVNDAHAKKQIKLDTEKERVYKPVVDTTPKVKKQVIEKKQVANKSIARHENKKYVVQVGSYSDKKVLDGVADFYKRSGYPTYVKSVNKSGITYYRLRVGPFTEKSKAAEYLIALRDSKYGGDSYISEGYF